MARHRVLVATERSGDAHSVPIDLLNHQADAWASTAAFQRWCREHLGREVAFIPLADAGRFHRFMAAAERWASMNGFQLPGPNGGTDWAGLEEMDLQRPRRSQFIGRDPVDGKPA